MPIGAFSESSSRSLGRDSLNAEIVGLEAADLAQCTDVMDGQQAVPKGDQALFTQTPENAVRVHLRDAERISQLFLRMGMKMPWPSSTSPT